MAKPFSSQMTSRQRVGAALRHKVTDRVPVDMWWTAETCEKLRKHLGLRTEQEVRDTLGLDTAWIWADYTGPLRKDLGENISDTYWGFTHRLVKYEGGAYMEYCHSPLAGADSIQQIEDYPWPNPDLFDYDALPGKMAKENAAGERWIGVGESAIFERAWALMGFESFLECLMVHTDVAVRLMEKVNDFYIEQTLRQLRACKGRADMVYIADDVGSQRGMLINPSIWRETVKPLQKKINDAILKEFPNVLFHYHCCGSIIPIIDDLIEVGVNVLNPVQPKAEGMQADVLAERWGDRLCFCGGLDIQDLLPHGTVEEVYRECVRLIRTLGKGGGYLLAPAHAVQVDTPVENVLAILRAAKENPPPEK